MRARPNAMAAVVAVAVTAVSCASPVGPVARQSTPVGDALPEVDELLALPDVDVSPLSIDDALLVGNDVPAPWDLMHRDLDSFAHDIGPNQTDCDPYWEYERLGRLQGGETMWWRDGGNLNHKVRREDSPGQAAELISTFDDLALTCGVTSWSEGDSFTIEPLDLSDTPGTHGIVALSIDHRRTDEVLWLAFAQRGDLISELRVTMWPASESGRIPAFSPSDFGTVAATMVDRLASAGPGQLAPQTSTPDSTLPGEPPVEVTRPTQPSQPPEIEIPENEPLPAISSPPVSVPVTTTAPLGGVAGSLLTTDELPAGWTTNRAEVYDDFSDGEAPLSGCPDSIVIVELERHFDYSVDLSAEGVSSWESYGVQFIGSLPGEVDPIALIESFATLACSGSEDGFDYVLSGSTTEVTGAGAAALVDVAQIRNDDSEIDDEDLDDEPQQLVLALATVDSTLTAFTLPKSAPVLDFLQRATDKIVATG